MSWQRAQELFEQAIAKPPEERITFLAEACGDDLDLRTEVESLLAHDEQATEGFMAPPQPVDLPSPTTETVKAETTPLSPGHTPKIEGYEIVRELHRGGQGVVYQALQKSTKRKVAIKVLLEGPYASPKARRRFEREIELVASLKHPNIVAIFHSGQTDTGQQFCVMDYVRGVPLTEYVKTKKPTLEEALKLFAAVCEAVNYAHQRGVIHRDLKPSNILVDVEGQPKVLDFGLAKMVGGPQETIVSITGQVVGTLPYMSPEQARGNPDEIDIRTDVYSLGVILYEMLTGHYPYPAVGQMADVLQHIARTQPTPPSRTWRPDSAITQRSRKRIRVGKCPIDDEVETIILRSLAKERERRYQSADTVAADVRHYLAQEPIEAKRDSRWYMIKTVARRNKVPAYFALAFLVTVPPFVILLTYLSVQFINYRAYELRLSNDHREVQLLASTGRILHCWQTDGYPFSELKMTRPVSTGHGRLGIMTFPTRYTGVTAGSVSAFAIDEGEYDQPRWMNRIREPDIPDVLRERGLIADEFGAEIVGYFDIFPHLPGHEIVAVFAHETYSPRAIRVVDVEGRTRYQVWHDGSVAISYHLTEAGILVFSGDNAEAHWTDRGVTNSLDHSPQSLFAITPSLDRISTVFPSEKTGAIMPDLVWYRCLLGPLDKVQLGIVHLNAPPVRYNSGRYVQVSVAMKEPARNRSASIGLIVDEAGREVPQGRIVSDEFRLLRDALPRVDEFYLADLPPVIKIERDQEITPPESDAE